MLPHDDSMYLFVVMSSLAFLAGPARVLRRPKSLSSIHVVDRRWRMFERAIHQENVVESIEVTKLQIRSESIARLPRQCLCEGLL